RRSSFDGMMNYYKANYPRPPYKEETYPPVKCRVLMIHGLDDPFLMPGTLNDTWRWLEKDLTLVTVPKAGHWVHQVCGGFLPFPRPKVWSTARAIIWPNRSAPGNSSSDHSTLGQTTKPRVVVRIL